MNLLCGTWKPVFSFSVFTLGVFLPCYSGNLSHVFCVGLFSFIVCVLSGRFQSVLGIFLKYFFDFYFLPQPPSTFYYHILYLPGCFYNFLFSFPSLCIYFFLYHGGMSSTFISQPLCCIIHFYYIVNFQELFFYF